MITPNYTYSAEVLAHHDGDTLRLRVDLGFETDSRAWIRLRDCWAEELPTPAGVAAAAALRELLPEGTRVIVQTEPYRDRSGATEFKRSFVRYVGRVYFTIDGAQYALSDWMVAHGFAKPLRQGTPRP